MLLFGYSDFYSDSERLDAYLNPQNTMVSDEFLKKNKDIVLLELARLGVSYPSEIARNLGIHVDTVQKILSMVKREGKADRMHPDHYHPNEMFEQRIPELIEMGLDTFDKVAKCGWWSLNFEGVVYLWVNYRGQGKKINRALVRYVELEPKDA